MRSIIVGDNKHICELITNVVRRHGYQCTAEDVWTPALTAQRARQAKFNLAIVHVSPNSAQHAMVMKQIRAREGNAKLLAIGPADDSKFILNVLREGADEYLVEDDLEKELEVTLVRIQVKDSAQSLGQIVGILGASGGCGASSIAANLAVALGSEAHPPALVDLRLAAGDLRLLLDLQPRYTLADLCQEHERMDGSMLQRALLQHAAGLRFLPAPKTLKQARSVTPEGTLQTLNHLQTMFTRTLVELDRSFGEEQLPAMSYANTILLVTRLDMTSLHHCQRILDQLDELGIRQQCVRLVVNRAGQPKELPARQAENVLGTSIFHRVPDDPARMNLAVNKGVPVVVDKPTSRVARSLKELAEKVASLKTEASPATEEVPPSWTRGVAAL